MSPRRRYSWVPGVLAAAAGLALAPFALGCDDADEPGMEPRDSGTDTPSVDAGRVDHIDGGPVFDGALPAPSEDDAPGGAGCFDFRDTDLDGMGDCDDPDCATAPVCCVGASSAECCAMDAALDVLRFDECASGGLEAVRACAPTATIFGSPTPELRGGGLVPNGGARFDSGLVLAGEVDPRVARLEITARITAEDRCDHCLDSVAVGLTRRASALSATSLVETDIAVAVSAARGEVQLRVGGATARAVPLESVLESLHSAPGATLELRLITEPSGRASVTVHAVSTPWTRELFDDVAFAPGGPARVVVWGRSSNRGAGDPAAARAERIEVTESTCDAPASLARGGEPILPDGVDGWWDEDERTRAPSVVLYEDQDGAPRARMVFAYQGRIHVAGGIEGGRFRALADPRNPANALLAPGAEAWWSAGLSEPSLVRGADGRFHLWFTATGADGATSIGRADGIAPDVLELGPPVQVLAPEPEWGDLGWDGPSVVEASMATLRGTYLAARRRTAAGGEIVLFHLSDAEAPPVMSDTVVLVPGSGEVDASSRRIRAATGVASDFDADEVAAPALLAYRDVLRLYYAGRRGTRWAIGAMLSQDGVYWREAEDGRAVLGGSGSGFDALSASDPSPVVEGGELRLYYTGSDGVHAAVGLARQSVPDAEVP